MIFDDFDKYNKEIQKIANRNNELLVMNSVAKVEFMQVKYTLIIANKVIEAVS